jgi:hypothetical protein
VVKALAAGRWSWKTEPEGSTAPIEFGINEVRPSPCLDYPRQEYSYVWMGQNYSEVVAYKPDMTGMMFVSKVDGRALDTNLTVTKNFMIAVSMGGCVCLFYISTDQEMEFTISKRRAGQMSKDLKDQLKREAKARETVT